MFVEIKAKLTRKTINISATELHYEEKHFDSGDVTYYEILTKN